MVFIRSGLLSLCSIAAVSLLPSPGFAQLSAGDSVGSEALEPIAGRQCVYNNGGYVLTVEWYDPGRIVYLGGDQENYSNYRYTEDPHSSNNISLGYSSCTDVANRVAVVRIAGHDLVNEGITIGVGTSVGIGSTLLGAIACVASASALCVPAFSVGGIVTGTAIATVGKALPDVNELAYIGVPGTENYLDFYGTVWTINHSSEVALTTERNAFLENSEPVVNFVTDGDPGPRSITYNNQAGYIAGMTVIYHEYRDVGGGTIISVPVVKESGDIPLGLSRHIDIPENVADIPITVAINGIGTIDSNVYSTTVPANFRGNQCFKSWGTIFDAQGGDCDY